MMPFAPKPIAPQSFPPKGGQEVAVGCSVLHERFGRGIVQALEGTGIDAKATVCFENAGTKVLMLRFAKLTVM
jgi:DNA helicase-2/ATP-dependent DNA helicase PcrA